MQLNDYKRAMRALALDESRKQAAYRRICLAERESAGSRSKYLRLPFAAAAALALILAGAMTVAAIGTGFFGLKQFFEKSVERSGTNTDIIDSTEAYGSDKIITASADNLTASIVETACDGHYIVAIVEVDASGCEIPSEAVPTFRRYLDDFHGGTGGMTLLSRSGSVFTYGYYNFGFAEIPDGGGKITLGGFGYYSDGGYSDYVSLSDGELIFDVKKEDLNILESVRSAESAEIEGITVSAELSPLGMLFTMSDDPVNMFGIEKGDDYLKPRNLAVYMRDGSVQDFDTGLLRSQNGWIDQDTGEYCEYIGFTAPVDISEVEYVAFHGVKFEFDKEENND